MTDEAKAELRATARARRASLPPSGVMSAGGVLARRLLAIIGEQVGTDRPLTVAVTTALPFEPPTQPTVDALRARGDRVIAPRVLPERQLGWLEITDATTWAPGPFGIAEPTGTPLADGLAAADVVIAPALMIDAAGIRLGQGGGYYDRALAAVDRSRTLVIGVVFDDEVVEALPADEHDMAVDIVVTPSRTRRLR